MDAGSSKHHGVRVVLAETRGGGTISCLTWLDLKKGDYVVYETRREKFIVLKVSRTTNIPPKLEKKATRFIVQKVELENYRKLRKEYDEKQSKKYD